MVNFIKDIDLIRDINKYDVILVGVNTYQAMGDGFQRKIRVNYKEVYEANLKTKYGDIDKLGTILSVTGKPTFVLCFINHGYNFRPNLNPVFLDYNALEKCMSLVNDQFKGLNVATTFIGCSKFDGNGDKDSVIKILEKNTSRINLYVYDYEQIPRNIENVIKYHEIFDNEEYTREEKSKLVNAFRAEYESLNTMESPVGRFRKLKTKINKLLKK